MTFGLLRSQRKTLAPLVLRLARSYRQLRLPLPAIAMQLTLRQALQTSAPHPTQQQTAQMPQRSVSPRLPKHSPLGTLLQPPLSLQRTVHRGQGARLPQQRRRAACQPPLLMLRRHSRRMLLRHLQELLQLRQKHRQLRSSSSSSTHQQPRRKRLRQQRHMYQLQQLQRRPLTRRQHSRLQMLRSRPMQQCSCPQLAQT